MNEKDIIDEKKESDENFEKKRIKKSKKEKKDKHSKSDRKKHKDKKKTIKVGKYLYNSNDTLGRGATAVVYKGLNMSEGGFVAMKEISLKKTSKDLMEALNQEIKFLRNLNHKNIIKYIDSKQTKDMWYIIMEYAPNGSLQNMIRTYRKLSEKMVAGYIAQVLEGLVYLHAEGVIHRDIKGANILIGENQVIKLADFGVASSLNEVDNDPKGTPYWMAPEVIEMKQPTTMSDIWSMGATVIELLEGKPPFFNMNQYQAMYKIVNGSVPYPKNISIECKGFLKKCFNKTPHLRKSAAVLLEDPWIVMHTKGTQKEEKRSTSVSVRQSKTPHIPKSTMKLLSQYQETEKDDEFGDEWDIDVSKAAQKNQQPAEKPDAIKKVQNFAFDRIIEQSHALYSSQSSLTGLIEEKEDDNYDDLFNADKDFFEDDESDGEFDFTAAIQRFQKNEKEDDDDVFQSDLEEEFNDIDDVFEEETDESQNQLAELLESIQPDSKEESLLETSKNLLDLIRNHRHLKNSITQFQGVLPIMQLLDVQNPSIVLTTLELINEIVENNRPFLETFCLVGALPTLMKFAEMSFSVSIRQEVSKFIKEIGKISSVALEMFIACNGLPILVKLMDFHDDQFEKQRNIIFTTIDNTLQVFNPRETLTVRLPKNDFCRLFARCNIFEKLTRIMVKLVFSKESEGKANDETRVYLKKITTILLLFSQADRIVKCKMVEEVVLNRFMKVMDHLELDAKILLMQTIKHLALHTSTRAQFDKVGSIPFLVKMLGDKNHDIADQALLSLNSILLFSPERQATASEAGIISHLIRISESEIMLKHITTKLLCDLCHSGKAARKILWENNTFEFFFGLLRTQIQVQAFESINALLQDDSLFSQVEAKLCKKKNIQRLIEIIKGMKMSEFRNCTLSLKKLINLSIKINRALGNSDFVGILINGIEKRSSDALVYVAQMQILQSLYTYSYQPKRILVASQKVIQEICDNKEPGTYPLMVVSVAKNLQAAFDEHIKL